jgi:1-acylglycerone phosphate reductase
MPVEEYVVPVTEAMLNRTPGKFWYGRNAGMVRMSTTATTVPQPAMVSCPFDLYRDGQRY